jgi:hypothetical protein
VKSLELLSLALLFLNSSLFLLYPSLALLLL